jgi:hypothetical protein
MLHAFACKAGALILRMQQTAGSSVSATTQVFKGLAPSNRFVYEDSVPTSPRPDGGGRIAADAKRYNVDLFHRFAVMRYWNEMRHISFRQSVSPDGLHMNDWSYGCMATLLATAIADAAMRGPQTAQIPLARQ